MLVTREQQQRAGEPMNRDCGRAPPTKVTIACIRIRVRGFCIRPDSDYGSGSLIRLRIRILIRITDPVRYSDCNSGSLFGLRIRINIRIGDPDTYSDYGSAIGLRIRISKVIEPRGILVLFSLSPHLVEQKRRGTVGRCGRRRI